MPLPKDLCCHAVSEGEDVVVTRTKKIGRLEPEKRRVRCRSVLDSLDENDFLFVDSSHVLKVGSDVGYIIFQILPRLKKGVIVHFHDVPWPFEYPKEWLGRGIIWNEAYFLRSFLQYNRAFPILYFNAYIHQFHREVLGQMMPLCLRNPGGGLWLKKAV